MYGQHVYVTVDADGPSTHYRTEEGNLAFHGVKNILWVRSHSGSLLVSESEWYADGEGSSSAKPLRRFIAYRRVPLGYLHPEAQLGTKY